MKGPIFNYDLQVWIEDGMVKTCGHSPELNLYRGYCCNAVKCDGMTEAEAIREYEKEERG